MSIFDLHASVVQDYRKYVQSFLSISDDRLRGFIENQIVDEAVFWPDALLQLNPAYELVEDVATASRNGIITGTTAEIFRDADGNPIRLYRHQRRAIATASEKQSYIVTSGTGSGKSLTYFIPIFDAILRGDHSDRRVWALVIYPMNALVNSQFEALEAMRLAYKQRTGDEMPVRFAKYTGQESDEEKQRIQVERPHILLTNYMMLEMMLLRPKESAFVDRHHSNLQFLVLDELHMYRGRQGADVAMLIRRLKERCGNDRIQHVGTSATMVASRSATGSQRRQAVADFATKVFGTDIRAENVIEESLVPVATFAGEPAADQLRLSLSLRVPQNAGELLGSPLTKWLETAVGIETDSEGVFRRKIPRSLKDVAVDLASATGAGPETCTTKLQEFFLAGSRVAQPGGGAVFPFKLHQFISQGRSVYATAERHEKRELTLDGQYYAKPNGGSGQRLLFPLTFCRVCGQEYYKVLLDGNNQQVTPWEGNLEDPSGMAERGYLLLPSNDFSWSTDDLPPEWLDPKGRIKREYRSLIPRELFVHPDGCTAGFEEEDAIRAYFQATPFLICQTCGEYYSQREGDFRKLTGLSNEGRSSATTTLGISTLHHAPAAAITGSSRKLLSFTDNRQDASLQAGHFNDFVLVSVLRSAIYRALDTHSELRHYDMADKAMACLDLPLREYAANRDLDPTSPQADKVRKEFRDLVQFRIYEDLRRGWRVVHPNLEQCGLLKIIFYGLEGACQRDDVWQDVPEIASLDVTKRYEVLKPFLDFARKKLAIHAECLRETYLQQLRIRVNQVVNERWAFDESEERLRPAERMILPNQSGTLPGIRLGRNSLIGRYFHRHLPGIHDYSVFIERLVAALRKQGLLREEVERGVRYVQLESAVLIWQKGDGTPPAPDPIYSRRVRSATYVQVQQKANAFFKTLYSDRARSLGDVEGLEHTAQISYQNREEREHRFRAGDLKLLFCSPTMELGIDIRDLQLVHMRNVPPTPASYAQRSGRAGRKGDPALILTYCSASSGHDQYYFRLRHEMVAGSVRPPRLDLSNEDLVRCHVQALWFAKVNLRIEGSITELLDLATADYPLREEIKSAITLSELRLQECIAQGRHVLDLCGADVKDAAWYTPDWIENVVRRAAERFGRAFDRWRQLYRAAQSQLQEAQNVQATTLDDKKLKEAQQRISEALRQRQLLSNSGTTRQESDFYPYRYLASEGFLPGYNFPRLPIRVLSRAGKASSSAGLVSWRLRSSVRTISFITKAQSSRSSVSSRLQVA